MKIEDAIKRYESWAEDDRIDVRIRKEHRQIADWLKELNADRPQGEWIKNYYGTVICSECKCPRRDNRVGHTKFCNACGAKMKGADDE